MPRAVAPSLTTELAKTVTTPGFLVEMGFSTPFRICSRDTVTFRGQSYQNYGFDISGLAPAADQAGVKGQLTIRDADRLATANILREGIEDKSIKVWVYYGDVPSLSAVDLWSPILLFDGHASDCSIDPGRARVSINLASSLARVSYSPRLRMNRENGFNWLPAKGAIIEFGGEKFEIEPE